MLRRPTFWFATLAIGVAMVLFRVKYEVNALEQHNVRLKKEIQSNKGAIHILKAEWTHLNDPKRLQNFSQKYLTELKPIKSSQLITFQDMAGASVNNKVQPSQKQNAQNALDAYMDAFVEDEAVQA